MPRRKPGSIRPVAKKATFVVKNNIDEDGKLESNHPTPIENVPESVNDFKKVVYCNFNNCAFNTPIDDLVHTESVVRNEYNEIKDAWKPLFKERVWDSVCTRREVVINMDRSKVPACFTPRTTVSGHLDFTKLMGESYTIDDNTDPTFRGEEFARENLPF